MGSRHVSGVSLVHSPPAPGPTIWTPGHPWVNHINRWAGDLSPWAGHVNPWANHLNGRRPPPLLPGEYEKCVGPSRAAVLCLARGVLSACSVWGLSVPCCPVWYAMLCLVRPSCIGSAMVCAAWDGAWAPWCSVRRGVGPGAVGSITDVRVG